MRGVSSIRRAAWLGRFIRAALLAPIFTLAMPLAGFEANAAVVFELAAADHGNAELYHPYGIAADALGNIFVADTNKHRIVEFGGQYGGAKRIFGSIGQGDGQLYYPQGIAVGTHYNGNVTIYVADTSNSRIVAFNDTGHFLGDFGEFGSGDGQLDNPGGVAFLKYPLAPGGLVLVADTRNNRIAIFDDDGSFKQNFYCSTCPNHQIRPLGISARWSGEGANSTMVIYAVDELTSQVQVLNSNGRWIRSIGKKGTGDGELEFPDDVAVDEDGFVFVVDSSFTAPRVSKFGPAGKFLYSFGSEEAFAFTQPHGVALDQQGAIYVANTGESHAYRFREKPPQLYAGPFQTKSYWISTKGAWFSFWYNGVEQTCKGSGTARFQLPVPNGAKSFTVDSGPVTVGGFNEKTKMDLTTAQVNLLKQAWNAGKEVSITANFVARCANDIVLRKTITFKR